MINCIVSGVGNWRKIMIKSRGEKMSRVMLFFSMVLLLSACQPEVGSDKWCEVLKAKDKGDWTMNEAKDFTKHCLFQ